MLDALDALARYWPLIGAFTAFSCLWSLICVGLSLANRKVPAIVAMIPTVIGLLVAIGIALYTSGNVPWDPSRVGMIQRIELTRSDFVARVALLPALVPGLGVLLIGNAIAAPLRGPRTVWPAGIGAILLMLALVGVTTGAVLDLDVAGTIGTLMLLVPAALVLAIGLVRGAPDSSGPEASLVAALAFGHLTGACMTALVATERYHMLLTHHLDLEVAAFRGPAGALAVLAAIGIAAAAATGVTETRGRTFGGLAGLASLGLWAPLALLGALPQLT